jgi:quercetin dioxygenase-like cupin family protein
MSMKRMLVGAALGAAMSGAIVSATPGSGTTKTPLGRATFEAFDVSRRVKAPQDPEERDGGRRTLWKVKAEAEPALDIATEEIKFAPHSHSGWHTHPGPVFISVIEGTMTFYEGDDCQPLVLQAGQGFVDGQTDGHAHIARNETELPARNLVTYFVPQGAAVRKEALDPGCRLSEP